MSDTARIDDQVQAAPIFAFGDWTFEPASGALTRGAAAPVRLQPQPAALLALLLERAGTVVTREEIVAAVWGDTTVEFDQAVNYGIRQIRLGLEESASDSRYIETLPRRGYRFLLPVRRVENAGDAPARPSRSSLSRWPVAVAVVVTLAVVAMIASREPDFGTAEPVVGLGHPVIAVMLLRHAETDSGLRDESERFAERVTARLTQLTAGRFRVVGPSTTAPYGAQRSAIARVRDELEARFVIGGSLDASSPDGLFLELIDTRDGAHLWAIVAEPGDPTLAARAADSVAARLLGTGSASPH